MAGTAEINKPEKGRKKRRLWLKILGGIIGVLVLFIGITFIVNVISNGIEKKKIESYGQYVNVEGKR